MIVKAVKPEGIEMDTKEILATVPGLDISVRDDRPPKWVFGGRTWVHAQGESTGGAMGMIEQLMDPGMAVPLHVHHKEDETVYIIEGRFRFICGDEQWESGPATWLKLPKGVQHGLKAVGDTPGRFLEFFLPAGLEKFFQEVWQDEPSPLPTGDALREMMVRLKKAAVPFGLDFVGPFPA